MAVERIDYKDLVFIDVVERVVFLSTKTANEDTGWDYDIPFSWLKNNSDIAHWMRHLSEKNWMTMDKFESFGSAIMKLADEGFI